jgi:PBP1b-binding outer membrane lipoprotein LpoB
MTNIKSNLTALIFASVVLTSCSKNPSTNYSNSPSNDTNSSTTPSYTTPEWTSSSNEKDPYEMMQVAFEGSPEISKIKPMLEAILEKYDLPKTDEYRLKVGSMLVSLRKASTVGVTEMEILKHIYQNGSNKISLPDQAGLSATLLEKSK